MAINRDSGGVFHLNKDRKMSKSEIERMASAVGTSNSQHKQLVPWAQNTSKEHFSPTNGEILPQNADNFAQNLGQSAPSPRVNITPAGEEPQNFTQPNPRVNITQGADFNATQNQEQAGVSGVYQRGKYLFTKDANGNELIQDPKTGQWHIYN